MVETIIFILQPILKSKNKLFFFLQAPYSFGRERLEHQRRNSCLVLFILFFVVILWIHYLAGKGKVLFRKKQPPLSFEICITHLAFSPKKIYYYFLQANITTRYLVVVNVLPTNKFHSLTEYFQDEETFFAAPLNFGNNLASIWYWSWQHWMAWVRKSKQELIMKSGILRDAAASNSLAFRENDGKEGSLLLAHSDLLVDDIARSKIPCSLPFMQ